MSSPTPASCTWNILWGNSQGRLENYHKAAEKNSSKDKVKWNTSKTWSRMYCWGDFKLQWIGGGYFFRFYSSRQVLGSCKVRRKYRHFPHIPCPHTCTAYPVINLSHQSSTLGTIDEPTDEHIIITQSP